MSWLNDAPANIADMSVTLSTAQPLMSSLKDTAAVLQPSFPDCAQNKDDMSVTPEVSHVEMWPYTRMAATRFENQSATAVLMVLSSATMSSKEGKKMGRVLRAPESKKCAKACWWNETNAELVN